MVKHSLGGQISGRNVATSLSVNKWPLLRSGWLGAAGQISMWKCWLHL